MEFTPQLEGKRIFLTKVNPSFELAKEIYDVVEQSRSYLQPWLPWVFNTNSVEAEFLYLQNWCNKHWEDKTGIVYLIREKNTQKFLGIIDFMHINLKNQSGEIGYWLCQDAAGHGYMSEALKLFETAIFSQDFNRIIIQNNTRNLRSINVAKRAGYKLEGIQRQKHWSNFDNCFVDINLWSKIKSDLKF